MSNQVKFKADLDDNVSSQLDKIRDKFNTIGGKGTAASLFGNVGAMAAGAALAGVGMAASAAADFIGQSIDASRDLSESLSKSRVVFGASAKDIEAFGSTAAVSMGLSKQAAIEAAASFGNLFVGLDMGQPKAAEMSKGIVKLAGDLASFNNLDPTEVLDKLRSGLSGESEPLRSVGVFLTEAKVKAKAMELGLVDAHGELSEGSKVLARYQLILNETGTAQGDFARTSEGLANSQRSASAQLVDAQAELGASFEPMGLAFTRLQVDFIQGFGVIGDAWTDIWDADNITEPERKAMAAALDAEKAGSQAMAAYMSTAAKDDFQYATQKFAERLPLNMTEARKHAVKVAQRTPTDIAAALREGRGAWQTALDTLRSDVDNKMSRAAEIAKLKGILAGKELAAGLRSKDPVVRAASAALQQTATERLGVLTGTASRIGDRAAMDLGKALTSKKLTVKQAAELLDLQVKNALGTLPSSAYGWGKGVGREFGRGITSKIPAVAEAAKNLAEAAGNYLEIRSPARKGAFAGIGPEGYGRNIGLGIALGMASARGAVEAASAGLVAVARPDLRVGVEGALRPRLALAGGFADSVRRAGDVHLHYSPQISTASPSEAQRFSQLVTPDLVRELRRQGLIA